MIAPPFADLRPDLTLELALGRGGRSARFELHRPARGPRVACITLRGSIDRRARARLVRAFLDLRTDLIDRFVFDCSEARRFGERAARDLVGALTRGEPGRPGVEFHGRPRRRVAPVVAGERAS